jgi:hypothetical protein
MTDDEWDNAPSIAALAAKAASANSGNDTLGIRCPECATVGLWRVFWVRHGANCKRRVLKCIGCGHKQATKEVPI